MIKMIIIMRCNLKALHLFQPLIVTAVIAIFVMLFAIGCRIDTFAYDVTELEGTPTSQVLDVPSYEYESIAWMDGDLFAVTYKPVGFNSDLSRLALLSMADNRLIDLAGHVRDRFDGNPCRPNKERNTHRIDAHNFSYVQECSYEKSGLIEWHGTLFKYNIETRINALIQESPRSRRILNADFTQGDSRVVVAEGAPPVKSQLFIFAPDGTKAIEDLEIDATELLGSYRSVQSPTWGVSGVIVAFASGDGSKEFNDSPVNLLNEPKDIVSINPDNMHAETLVKGLGNTGVLKWAPDGSRLAFGSRVQGKPGIWILDLTAQSIRQVWPRNEFFDWSPDGQSMVILDDPDGGNTFEDPTGEASPLPHSPVVIDVKKGE